MYRTYKWAKYDICVQGKSRNLILGLTLGAHENQLWIWWKVVIKHYSKKKAIQSIKADQRSLEERKESVMNLRRPSSRQGPRVVLSYREIIECRYIGLFSILKSISYRTFHIEYHDILKTSDFCLFSPKTLREFRKFWKPMNQSPQRQQRRKFQKFWKFAKNSLKRRSFLKPSYCIVSRKKP